jgi:hypothetical protein
MPHTASRLVVETAPSVLGALHAAALPPSMPEHAHVQGPLPLTRLAMPRAHKSLAGTAPTATLLALPQAASTR